MVVLPLMARNTSLHLVDVLFMFAELKPYALCFSQQACGAGIVAAGQDIVFWGVSGQGREGILSAWCYLGALFPEWPDHCWPGGETIPFPSTGHQQAYIAHFPTIYSSGF